VERSVIEIGWSFLARAYWGGRYNGEMKRLMVEHAFRSVKRVIFIIGPENRRSQRAVEKIGGMRAGTTTDAQGRERVVYDLTPELFARRKDAGGRMMMSCWFSCKKIAGSGHSQWVG
jgi:RimJ/RimL family protein N-acetyltransferase